MTQWKWETEGSEVVSTFKGRVKGRTILITGPSPGGIGAQTAIDIAAGEPSHLLLAGRMLSKIQPVLDTIKSSHPAVPVEFIELDLSSQASVRSAAEVINKKIERLDILIANAAIMATPYAKTVDGIESQFATNHIGHFLLTNLLMGKILAAAPGARIVNVSSSAHRAGVIRFEDWNFSDGNEYNPWAGYAQSKMANVLFTGSLAEKLGSKGVFSYSLNPGSIRSNLQVHVNPELMADGLARATEYEAKHGRTFKRDNPKSLEQGCSTTLVAALDPSIEEYNGAYLNHGDLSESTVKENFEDPKETKRKLWELSEKLVGEKFEV